MNFRLLLIIPFFTLLGISCKSLDKKNTLKVNSPLTILKQRLKQDTIRIAYLGGSITNGAGASAYNKSWASLLENKIKREQNKVVQTVNLGIGASDSEMGLYRFAHVMAFKPDILITEFAVNDHNMDSSLTVFNHEQLHLLSQNNDISMLSLNLNKENNQSNYRYIRQVVEHHHLPNVRVKMEDNDLVDGVHPGDEGHQKICDQVYDYLVNINPSAAYTVPQALSNKSVKQVSADLELLDSTNWSKTTNSFYYLKSTVVNDKELDTTRITFKGSRIAIATVLRQQDKSQNGILKVKVDTEEWKTISCLNSAPYIIVKTHTLAENLNDTEHQVSIVTVPDTLENGELTKQWEILSVLTAQ